MNLRRTAARLVAIAMLAALATSCTQSVDDASVHEDWCERAEAWGVAFEDVGPRFEEDPSSVTEEELRHLDEVMDEFAAATPPEPIEHEWAVMIGDVDLPDDPFLAEEEFFDAVRVVSAYAEDECGLEFDEEPFG